MIVPLDTEMLRIGSRACLTHDGRYENDTRQERANRRTTWPTTSKSLRTRSSLGISFQHPLSSRRFTRFDKTSLSEHLSGCVVSTDKANSSSVRGHRLFFPDVHADYIRVEGQIILHYRLHAAHQVSASSSTTTTLLLGF